MGRGLFELNSVGKESVFTSRESISFNSDPEYLRFIDTQFTTESSEPDMVEEKQLPKHKNYSNFFFIKLIFKTSKNIQVKS